jgi:hypothetical protein
VTIKPDAPAAPDKTPFRDALLAALTERAPDPAGSRLGQLADRRIALAAAGERWAMSEIIVRRDGRALPAPDVEQDDEPRRVVVSWKDSD